MRKSTDLTDELKAKRMVKVYRAFIRMAIQAIRYSGGFTRQFAGDGIMGVFQDSIDEKSLLNSSQKAVNAARYIQTLIDYCLNPALKRKFGDICIGCGIGICTGNIMITKVGMRGKESNDTEENETGIVWVGSTTNYASRYCSLAKPREIFIDEKTYNGIEKKEIWNKICRAKGNKAFTGYAVTEYYLELSEDIAQEAVKSEEQLDPESTFIQNIFDETQEKALLLVDEISKKSAELSVALENLKKRESQVSSSEKILSQERDRLQQWQQRLDAKQVAVDEKETDNKQNEYKIFYNLFAKTYCKDGIIKAVGKDYWTELIEKMYALGSNIGKSQLQVKIDLYCYLVDIYMCFDMYEEAYEALCIQAEYSSWLNSSVVENVVRKSEHWAKLKEIFEKRVYERKDYQEALQKLKSMGY
ncbi:MULTISPECIES: adenylate/guanylate cyclase domain-containing protein [Acutalibacteraceae]|uniref:adenylate/guanylate cyclase domain-containing protein n=2 Tax=Acutalibacteraceae TaxID=3082771 RepID=UPI001FAAD4F4|nr:MULTISPECIES: hypothetical protein [Acutalibacteraceae]